MVGKNTAWDQMVKIYIRNTQFLAWKIAFSVITMLKMTRVPNGGGWWKCSIILSISLAHVGYPIYSNFSTTTTDAVEWGKKRMKKKLK